jgi:hypothetical protein
VGGRNEEGNVVGMISNTTRVTSNTSGQVAMEIVTETQVLEDVSPTIGHAYVEARSL